MLFELMDELLQYLVHLHDTSDNKFPQMGIIARETCGQPLNQSINQSISQ